MPLDQAALHRLIEACLRDRMRAKPFSLDQAVIRRCLGLEPKPPKTDLAVQRGEETSGAGWRREQCSFASQPGVRLTGLVYRPNKDAPYPLVVCASDRDGRCSPWTQALGIALALHGFVTLIIDPPGAADRSEMGDPYDPVLSAAMPSIGVYVWDIVRAIDMAIAEFGVLRERVGIIGCGVGGDASLLAATIDDRISTLALSGAGHSQEAAIDATYRMMPGVADIGDWANLAAGKAPMPILFLSALDDAPKGIEDTVKKLSGSYRGKDQAGRLRTETFVGPRDLNRRMREAAAAFFAEYLQGAHPKPYLPEPLPLTDGKANPAAGNTEDPAALSQVTPSLTFRELVDEAMGRPYPELEPDLIPWGKYGRLEHLPDLESIRLVDHGESPNVICLPSVDARMLVPLGLSVADFYAQLLHLLLPGGPEGWEPLGLQGDALTAMIASVRTLMKKSEPRSAPRRIEAEGPVSSLTARLLKQMRPEIEITVTDLHSSWSDCIAARILVPGARYRKWPWVEPSTVPVEALPSGEVEAIQWTADDEVPETPDVSIGELEPATAAFPVLDAELVVASEEDMNPAEPAEPVQDAELIEASDHEAPHPPTMDEETS